MLDLDIEWAYTEIKETKTLYVEMLFISNAKKYKGEDVYDYATD